MITLLQKQLNLLGLATRARRLVTGEESVLADMKQKKIALVIMAEDCSSSTKKKIADKCNHYKVDLIEQFSTMDISNAIGKKRSIVAFADKGFANSFKNLAQQHERKEEG